MYCTVFHLHIVAQLSLPPASKWCTVSHLVPCAVLYWDPPGAMCCTVVCPTWCHMLYCYVSHLVPCAVPALFPTCCWSAGPTGSALAASRPSPSDSLIFSPRCLGDSHALFSPSPFHLMYFLTSCSCSYLLASSYIITLSLPTRVFRFS